MKRLLYILFCCLPVVGWGQVINTVAGTGSTTTTTCLGNGVHALAADLDYARRIEMDRYGNCYIAHPFCHVIRKISNNDTIAVYAGIGTPGFSGDGGSALEAELKGPNDVAIDKFGNIFIADGGNNRIRRVDGATGIITTYAGNGGNLASGDGGPAIAASLEAPYCVAVDRNGNVFIGGGNRIRKVDTAGIITTIAGNGASGHTGNGGPAINALVGYATALCVDSADNLFISFGQDFIRRIDVTGIIHAVAGNGNTIYNGDNIPALQAGIDPDDIALDRYGNIFIAQDVDHRVRMINTQGIVKTIAGNGTIGFSGDGGPASAAVLDKPFSVTVDTCGRVYVYDNSRIRKISGQFCGSLSVVDTRALTFTVFPNPASTQITITSNNKLKELWLCNAVGQVAMKQNCGSQKATLDIEQLPAGVYFVRVVDENGAQRTEKVVKQ